MSQASNLGVAGTDGEIEERRLRRSLSSLDLTLIGFGSIFGSGWLFAASRVGTLAGPAGCLSWLFGGIAVLLLGLVYCELGAALPQAGGVIRYPAISHGPLMGTLTGFITLIAFSSLIAIEIVAARQYASAWIPALDQPGSSSPTLIGWLLQSAILLGCFWLNYRGIRTFALFNNVITFFKFLVPVLVVAVLLAHFQPGNFTSHGFAPFGVGGIEAAVSSGGVIFAYLGLTPIVSVAGEVRDPQRAIPIALIASIMLSALIYVLLQVAFISAVPATALVRGWTGVEAAFLLPYHDIAVALGLGWLAVMVVIDAVISPSGTGNIYMSATPRIVYGWSRTGTFPRLFSHVDPRTGVPVPALWLTLGLSLLWTLPFPSWDKLIGVVSSALMLSYALAPVSVAALRRDASVLPRPFRVAALPILGPLSFMVGSLIIYWSGWSTVSWLLGTQILLFFGYIVFSPLSAIPGPGLAAQVRAASWLVGYCALMMLISWLGSFGGRRIIAQPYDLLCVAAVTIGCYHWGARTGIVAMNRRAVLDP